MQSASQSLTGTGALVLWGTVKPSQTDIPALDDWWTNEHLVERLRLPGFLRARRYRALPPLLTSTSEEERDASGYLALYEVRNVQDLVSQEYVDALNNPTERTRKFMPCLAQMTRVACETLASRGWFKDGTRGPQMCNFLGLGVFYLSRDLTGRQAGSIDALRDFLYANMEEIRGVDMAAVHIVREDEDITRRGSASKSYDGVGFSAPRRVSTDGMPLNEARRYIVLMEYWLRPPLEPLRYVANEMNFVRSLMQKCGGRGFEWEGYEWICTMNKGEV